MYRYKYVSTCSHSYKDCGVCSKCGFVYDWESTLDTTKAGRYKALKAFTPRVDQPYSAATSANFCVVTGATYNVVGVYTNAYKTDGVPNKWYKFECNGSTYYGYSGDFEFVEYFDQQITGSITSPANGAVIPKESYPIKGTVTSSRYPLQKVDAYLDGDWYATVTLGNSKTLSLQNSQIDTKLKVQDLAPGEHRLTLRACDIHHSSSTVVVCSNLFTVSSSGSGSGSGTSSYTLSFDSQDGSSVGSITAESGAAVTIPTTIPELFGSNFEGWEASDGTVYQPGDSFTLTKNVTLTARWINYWITYESVGSWAHDLAYPESGYYCKLYIPEQGVYKIEGHSAFDTKVSLYDSNGNLLASDDDSGEGNQFLITANLSVLEPYYMMCIEPYYSTQTGELIWSVAKGKTVEYRDPVTQQVYEKDFADQPTIGVHEIEVLITSFIPTKDGHTLLGWSTSSTATTPMYQPGEYVILATDATSYNTVTLYPVWGQITEFPGIRQTYSYTILQAGQGTTFTLTVPESTTYRFIGLNDSSLDTKIKILDSNGNLIAENDDGGGNRQFLVRCNLTAGEKYTVSVFPFSSSATGTMHWQIDLAYDVRYIAAGAVDYLDFTEDDCSYPLGSGVYEYVVTTIVPTRPGYRFLGWSTDAYATVAEYQAGETVQLDSRLLYAVWERTGISGTCGDNLNWTLGEDGTLTISGTGRMYDYPTGPTPWQDEASTIRRVVVEQGVTYIGTLAFRDCVNLESATIANGVTCISGHAFFNCAEMTSVAIPGSVTDIYAGAFYGCTSLTDVYYSGRASQWEAIDIEETSNEPLANATIHTTDPVISGIAVKTQPSKTEYWIGEELDTTGLTLTATYSDGSTQTVSSGFTTSGFSSATAGSKTVTVTYNGKTATFTVTVKTPTVTGITVKTQPTKTEYWIGEELDTTGLTLTATYSDGSTQTVSSGFTTSGFSNTTAGSKTVTVTYNGKTATFTVTVKTPTVTGITIKTQPTKMEYWIGEELDTTGLTLTATYSDGSTQTVSSGFTTSGFSNTTAGSKTVTVTYNGKTATFTVTVKTPTVTGITIKTQPTKMEYWIGEELDTTGLTLTATYSDGSTQTVSSGFTTSGFDSTSAGTNAVTVTYAGKTATLTVTIKPGIGGACGKNLTWSLDEAGTLTISGIGTMEAYTDDEVPWRESRESIQRVIIEQGVTAIGSYAFYKCTQLSSVSISDSVTTIGADAFKSCASLVLVNIPDSITTIGGRAFNSCTSLTTITLPDGLTIINPGTFTACTDLTDIFVPNSVKTIGFAAFRGCTSLTDIYWSGRTSQWEAIHIDTSNEPLLSATLHTTDPAITGIAVKTEPTKTEYWIGEELDTTGLTLTATYSDGSTQTVSSGFTTSGFSSATAGSKIVTVTYNGKSATFTVTVKTPTVTGVTVKTQPGKTEYWIGEELDTTGLTLTATYSDGSTQTVSSGFTASGFSSATAGSKTVTVTYNGKSATFTVTVKTPTITGIVIKTQPTKTEYWIGEELDTTGLTLTATYSDGSTQTVSSGFTTSGFSNTTAGSKTVTVTYNGKTATFTVTVKTPTVTGITIKTQPTKMEYWIGEELDTTGLTLTATYSDGSTQTVSNGFTTSAFSSATAGSKTVTVTYNGKTAAFDVVVNVPDPEIDENAPRIIIDSVRGTKGNTVNVRIRLKNNPGIAAMKLKVAFGSALTLTKVTYNSEVGGQFQPPQSLGSPVTLNWFNGVADCEGDWVYATLTFLVAEDAQEGTSAAVSVTYEPDNVYDISETNIPFVIENGSVLIANYIPGDINGDESVNMKDVTRLFQYMSDWDVAVVEAALDVNGDGNVNMKDVTRLFQYMSDWDVEIY